MKNKKAWFGLILVIFALVALIFSAVVLRDKQNKLEKVIGERQFALYNLYANAEAINEYVRLSATTALPEAILEAASEGGTISCNKFGGYAIWYDGRNICSHDAQKLLTKKFNENINPYIMRYATAYLPLDNYEISYNKDTAYGIALENNIIPSPQEFKYGPGTAGGPEAIMAFNYKYAEGQSASDIVVMVDDKPGVLSKMENYELNRIMRNIEQATKVEIKIIIESETIDTASLQNKFEKIGKKGLQNGILILVNPQGQIGVLTGAGLQKVFSDETLDSILSQSKAELEAGRMSDSIINILYLLNRKLEEEYMQNYFKDNITLYSFKSSFTQKLNYNFSDYGTLMLKAQDVAAACSTESDVQSCFYNHMQIDGFSIAFDCGDDKALTAIPLAYQSCLESVDDNCICKTQFPAAENGEYQVSLSQSMNQVYFTYGDSSETAPFTLSRTDKRTFAWDKPSTSAVSSIVFDLKYENLQLSSLSAVMSDPVEKEWKLTDLNNGKEIILYKDGQQLALVDDDDFYDGNQKYQQLPECRPSKRTFRVCAENKNSYFLIPEDGQLVRKNPVYRFAIHIVDRVPPPEFAWEDFIVEPLGSSRVAVRWKADTADDIMKYHIYYSTSFFDRISADLSKVELNYADRTTYKKFGIKQATYTASEPYDSGILYYFEDDPYQFLYILQLNEGQEYSIGIAAVDRDGNEFLDHIMAKTTSSSQTTSCPTPSYLIPYVDIARFGQSYYPETPAQVQLKYGAYIDQAASLYPDIPKSLIIGVISQESKGNQNAVSPDGAAGLMQLMPGTAHNMGLNYFFGTADYLDTDYNIINTLKGVYVAELLQLTRERTNTELAQIDQRFDPYLNILTGTKYLHWLMQNYCPNDYACALAAYNSGWGNTRDAKSTCDTQPSTCNPPATQCGYYNTCLRTETQDYVPKVFAYCMEEYS